VVVVSNESAAWFAVQVVPQHEKKVALSLQQKGYEQFLPEVEARTNWSDRKKILARPLIPGYVFLRTTRGLMGAVLRTPSVYRIVSFGGCPFPAKDEEIAVLRKLVTSGRPVRPVPYLALGQKVQVKEGPLAGLTGIIVRLKNVTRVIVSVELIMRSVAIDVASSEIDLIQHS
jgi:transcriptional antiterminator NusG